MPLGQTHDPQIVGYNVQAICDNLGKLVRQDRAHAEESAIAATAAGVALTNACPVKIAGPVQKIYVVVGHALFAAGEHVSIDVKKNGVSILTAPIVVDNTFAAGASDQSADVLANAAVAAGDKLSADFTYTAGGGPNHPDVAVLAVWGT
jgi:hypothetical protein